ncbi:MAG: tRNA pseudouridine(55) synthase TruB [Deltaproteobacteria bacterium]|nr:tRNA pseudouridine(55) synthase TruB [Deltaproteobacteria bacterium]
MKPSLHGVIVVDKPAGPSSFGVVKTVRRLLQVKKIGHLGTLDPFAVGVLPLCLNEATKLTPFLLEQPKTYRATVFLGAQTDTQDSTGTLTASNAPLPSAEVIARTLATFVGEQWQTPPLFSALHFQGRRLYQYARQGIAVEVPPRKITIMDLTLESLQLPEVTFRVTCSKGAYIRTLAADLGRELGCGAYLQALQRLRVGPFTLDQAMSLPARPDEQTPEKLWEHLIPLADCLPHLPTLQMGATEAAQVRQGRSLPLAGEDLGAKPGEHLKVVWQQTLVAVAVLVDDLQGTRLQPVRGFNS